MSSEPRITTIRKSADLDTGCLKLPFLFIQKQFGYSVESILRPIHGGSLVNLGTYPQTFPNTIGEFHWICSGNPGQAMWAAIGQLTNGLYFFYTATCVNTQKTFLDGGQMNLWVSRSYADIIEYAMDIPTYNKYILETTESASP